MSDLDWNAIIGAGDAETIWNALYSLVRETELIRGYTSRLEQRSPDDFYSDITQEVFLGLITWDRFTLFLRMGYTNEQIESDLLLNELVPVLISRKGNFTGEASDDEHPASSRRCQQAAFKISHASKPA
jgi:hypothetical protein